MDALNYPFDISKILANKKKLKIKLLEQKDFLAKRIAILGGSTTSEIKNVLELFLLSRGIKSEFYESEYNKYYEDAMFGNPALDQFKPDVIYIHTTIRNIQQWPSLGNSNDPAVLVGKQIDHLKQVWQSLQSRYQAIIIQNNFELPQERVIGNLEFVDPRGGVNFVMTLNQALAKAIGEVKNVYVNDIFYLSSKIGLERWHDRQMWYSNKYALSYEAIPLLAHNLAALIGAIYGKSKKVLVADLDNTLWGGVIGDDGVGGIHLGEGNPLGEAYLEFQRYLKKLHEAGILLGIASKNEEKNAEEGLCHPDSILTREHFAGFKVNWTNKDQNISDMAKELNLGCDSFVFADDNPVERELIKANLPMIATPNIGDNVLDYISHLDGGRYFELVGLAEEDLKRNLSYAQNVYRELEEKKFTNYAEFLSSLQMEAEIAPFNDLYMDRITQLINKTNQFNVTTKRYSQAEVSTMAQDPSYITLYGRLKDKFGDHGLIAVTVAKIEGKVANIDLWLMSCRVLKRDMEQAMMDEVVSVCQKRGIEILRGYYIPTPKNAMVVSLFKTLGFAVIKDDQGETTWEFRIPKDYQLQNKLINVK